MFNLVKMNFYRLFHQKSFYILIAASALTCWFMVYLMWAAPRLEERARANLSQTEGEITGGFHVGIAVGETEESGTPVLEEFNFTEFLDEFLSSGLQMILISVGAAMIANAEQKRGFLKNLAGQMKPRGMLAGAKLPVILFETAVVLGVTVLGLDLSGRIYFEQYTAGDIGAVLWFFPLELLLCLAFGALILMVCTIARNGAAGIIVGILLSSGLPLFACSYINRFAMAYLGAAQDFDISRYTLEYQLMHLTSTAGPGDMVRALVVGTVYLLLAVGIGCLVMEKRDI